MVVVVVIDDSPPPREAYKNELSSKKSRSFSSRRRRMNQHHHHHHHHPSFSFAARYKNPSLNDLTIRYVKREKHASTGEKDKTLVEHFEPLERTLFWWYDGATSKNSIFFVVVAVSSFFPRHHYAAPSCRHRCWWWWRVVKSSFCVIPGDLCSPWFTSTEHTSPSCHTESCIQKYTPGIYFLYTLCPHCPQRQTGKGSAKSNDNIHDIYIVIVLHSELYRNIHLLLVVLNILDFLDIVFMCLLISFRHRL